MATTAATKAAMLPAHVTISLTVSRSALVRIGYGAGGRPSSGNPHAACPCIQASASPTVYERYQQKSAVPMTGPNATINPIALFFVHQIRSSGGVSRDGADAGAGARATAI